MTSLSTKFQIIHFFLDFFRITVQGQRVRQRRENLLLFFLNKLFRNQGISPRDMTGSSFHPSFILALFVQNSHLSSPQGPALWDPVLVPFPMRWVDFPAQLRLGLFTWLALANKLWADITPGTIWAEGLRTFMRFTFPLHYPKTTSQTQKHPGSWNEADTWDKVARNPEATYIMYERLNCVCNPLRFEGS